MDHYSSSELDSESQALVILGPVAHSPRSCSHKRLCGITEDIITELSRFESLFVIARNSSFAFKGQAIDVTEIGKKLGVQFIVEGSVRKAGDRIRITAQLIEASRVTIGMTDFQ